MQTVSSEWLETLRGAKRAALISHISPDGDTIGASLALRLALISMGKQADVFCDDPVPANLLFLTGADTVRTSDQAEDRYDLAVSVDVSDYKRLGECRILFEKADKRLVIDHHETNPGFGDHNFIRGGESSTCLLVFEVISALNLEFAKPIAECLLTGMSTDTGHFQYSCTTPETLAAAGKLVECGADISGISRHLYRCTPMRKIMLTKVAYQKMRFEADNRIGVITLSEEDFARAGCPSEESDGLVNNALEIEGVRFALLVKEKNGVIKCSLRSVEPDTVSDVAAVFGGGGHAQAAGCSISGMTLEDAGDTVVREIKKKLKD